MTRFAKTAAVILLVALVVAVLGLVAAIWPQLPLLGVRVARPDMLDLLQALAHIAVLLAVMVSFAALEQHTSSTDVDTYLRLADRLDQAHRGYLQEQKEQKADMGRKFKFHTSAKRLSDVTAAACDLYFRDLLPPATNNMVAGHLATMLPFEDEYLKGLIQDQTRPNYRRIADFEQRLNEPRAAGQLPPAS